MESLKIFKLSTDLHKKYRDNLYADVSEIVKKIGPTIVSKKMGNDRTYVNKTLKKNISDENLIAIAEVLEEME